MTPEPGRERQPRRTHGALAALLLAALAAALPEDVRAQPSVRPVEKLEAEKLVPSEEAMPDSSVQLPPFPRGRDLVELDSVSFEQGVRVFLDPASLSQPAPGLVRYTMLLVSAKGTGNLFFEGINCDREEWRTLAFGTGEGTFELIRNPRWRTLQAGANAGHRRVLAREFVCIQQRRIPDRAEDLRRRLLKRNAMAGFGHAARSNR